MPKHMPFDVAIVAAFLLGSCDNMPRAFTENDRERLAIAEANLIRAARASSDLVDRVERGEARIDELEREMRDRENMEEAIIADFRSFTQRYNGHTH